MADIEKIFQGDTLPVSYECRRPDPDDPIRYSGGWPATPVSAYARVRDTLSEVFLEIGGPGVITAPCTIEPATGSSRNDRGALVNFVVSSEFTQVPGTYVLYITAEFSDGAILTEDRKYRVNEFR